MTLFKKNRSTIKKLITIFGLLAIPLIGVCQEYENERKLPKDSILIKNHFTIIRSTVSLMGSIDWNSWFQCYDMELKSAILPELCTIRFLSRKFLSPGIKPLIKKLPEINRSLRISYPYNYSKTNDSVYIDVPFVNRKTISSVAEQNLRRDLEECGLNPTLPDMANSLLISTKENHSWHVWIIMENGDAMLWYYKGGDVLGLDKNKLIEYNSSAFPRSFQIFDANGILKE